MQAQIHAPRTGYAYNLLDNSDFRNPVNQRGQTSYTGNQYTIDRWRTYSVGATVSVANGYVGINDALMQYVLGIDTTKIYTAAVARPDGSLSVTSGTFGVGFGNVSIGIRCGVTSNLARFLIEGTVFPQIAWAALYEGAYTADTLPPYQPKGYAAELAECKRYYELLDSGTSQFVRAYKDDVIAFCVDYYEKRAVPVISMTGALGNALNVAGVGAATPTSIESAAPIGRKSARVNAMGSFDTSKTYAISYGIARLSISSDL